VTSVCNRSETPLNHRMCVLYSVPILVEAREPRNAWFFGRNVNGSGGELEIKKGVELSWVAGWVGVETSDGSGVLSSGNWCSIQCKFSRNSPEPLHPDNTFFSLIALLKH